jgi:HEAT repeat protein
VKNPVAIRRIVLVFLIALCPPPLTVPAYAQPVKSPPPSAAELIKGLQSPNLAAREQAEKAAMEIKPLPMPLTPALLNACRGLSTQNGVDLNAAPGDEPPRCNTGYVVQALQNAGAPVLPQLLVALDDNDESVRKVAADTLLGLAHDSPAAWPAIITAMANTHDDIPPRIAGFLPDKIGAPIAPLLVRSLSDSKPRIRGGSALALSWLLQRYATPNAPNDNVGLRSALNKYGVSLSGAVLDIAKVLNSLEPDQRAQTIQGLAGIGPPSKSATPYILPMFKDHDPSVRWSAVDFFGAMGQADKVALSDLLDRLKNDPKQSIRVEAMKVLGAFGPDAKDAVPDLAIALNSTDTEVVEQASLALANIEPSHEGILPGVMLALNDLDHPEDKENAFKALNKLGSRAKPAAPALVNLIATDLDSENSDDKAPRPPCCRNRARSG